MRDRKESKSAPNGQESVLVFDQSLLDKNLKVVNHNIVYYDQAFTIDIK